MDNLANTINKTIVAHNKLAHDFHQNQQEATAEKMIDALNKIVAFSYDKAAAYTNVVLVAGYASFFALWSTTKPVLTHWLSLTALLLMTISATVFVLFELYKMIHSGRFFLDHKHLITDQELRKDPKKLQAKLNEFEQLQNLHTLRFTKVWVVVLWLTVPTGVIAVGLLVFNYLQLLLKGMG